MKSGADDKIQKGNIGGFKSCGQLAMHDRK